MSVSEYQQFFKTIVVVPGDTFEHYLKYQAIFYIMAYLIKLNLNYSFRSILSMLYGYKHILSAYENVLYTFVSHLRKISTVTRPYQVRTAFFLLGLCMLKSFRWQYTVNLFYSMPLIRVILKSHV